MRFFKNPIGFRFKLVFLSSFLLVIPWLGYLYILEMENYLRRGQEQIVLGTAQALATALNERPELFDEGRYAPVRNSEDLYVYPVFNPLSLNDGKLNDWGAYQQYEAVYDINDYLRTELNPSRYYNEDDSLSFKTMVGSHNGSLYAYFKIKDKTSIYRSRDSLSINRSDFLRITVLPEGSETIRHYVVSPHEPEFLYPFEVNTDFSDPRHEERISGQWYETDNGYEVELQIPMGMLGAKLGFAFFDVDDQDLRNVESVVATYGSADIQNLGFLRLPTPELDSIVAGMGYTNSRIQVVDRSGRVLLTEGDIQSATGLALERSESPVFENAIIKFIQEKILNPLYYQILTNPSKDFIDELYSSVSREGSHLDSAFQGIPNTQFRTLADTQTRLLEAAYPILVNNEVLGAVVVDQNMNGLRTFRNQALETLFNTMLGVMVAIAFGLFLFGPKLIKVVGSQITKLNQMRAYCVALSAAITVIVASWLGLPVSSTHIAVGSIFGVGFFREWDTARRMKILQSNKYEALNLEYDERKRRKLVRRSHFMSIIAALLITVPAAAIISGLIYISIATLA